jgi:hypothetical protein
VKEARRGRRRGEEEGGEEKEFFSRGNWYGTYLI